MPREQIEYRLYKAYLSVTRFFISLTKTREYHLGTRVYFRGIEYIIVNNANFRDRFGRIYELERAYGPKMRVRSIPVQAREVDIKKVASFSNLWHDATYWWKWYKRNWLLLDANAMVKNKTPSSIKILGKNKALGRR